MITSDPVDDRPAERRSPLATIWRVLVALIVVASFGIWVYAYSGLADRPPPDLLADVDLAARAETICAAAAADVAAMPTAIDATDGADRAAQVRTSTDRYEAMVDELALLEVTEAEDRVIVDGWLGDWRTLIQDRRTYADAVAVDPEAVFLMTKVSENERLDKRLTRMATTNGMPSCVTPTDVG